MDLGRSRWMPLLAAALFLFPACSSSGRENPSPGPAPAPAPARIETPPPEPVRPAYGAGRWYPDDPDELRRVVSGFLDAAAGQERFAHVVALVSPHAGFVYSGPVAGQVYATVKNRLYDTVVLVGISHRGELDGISVVPKGSYATPLGAVSIDEELAAALLKNPTGRIRHQPAAHERDIDGATWAEHSLENQLPFLQVALAGSFRIVPVLLRARDLDDLAILADALDWALSGSGRKALLVASTDLSHFPKHVDARSVDREIMAAAATLDPQRLLAVDRQIMRRGIAGLSCTMCGLEGVAAVLLAAQKLGATGATVLDVRDSHDTAGADPSRVVGYGALVIHAKEGRGMSLKTKQILLAHARAAARAGLEGERPSPPAEKTPEMNGPGGAFVTLRNGEDLRGCIGNYNLHGDRPLWQIVEMMAVAATRDSRFIHHPVTVSELDGQINIEISVLSPFRRVTDPGEIVLGVHGVSLVWKGARRSVYLPQVATETGWDLPTFLANLCRKGGLPRDAWQDRENMAFDLFTAEVFHE